MGNGADNSKKGFFDFMKDYIALAIVVFSFVIMIILLCKAFGNIDTDDKFGFVKDIIGLFLPVIGTWMGTVLAFYFTKQNFEAANKSMLQTIDKLTAEEKLKKEPATNVMIPYKQIDIYPYAVGDKWDTVPISSYIKFLNKNKRNRLVVFDPMPDKARAVFHKSKLTDFLYTKASTGTPQADVDKLTLADLMSDSAARESVNDSIEFVGKNATLFDVQQKLISDEDCSDVFITASGKKDEAVTGWITNVIVAEYIQV